MDRNVPDQQQFSHEGTIANVLIVDEDPALTRLVLRICARKGIRGIIAQSVENALACIDKGDYDLIFTSDRIRPRPAVEPTPQSVFDLIDAVKTDCPEMPVVMVSEAVRDQISPGGAIAEAAVKAVRAGCCDFLIKPPEPAKIENLLDTLLPNHLVQTCEAAQRGIRNLYQIVGKSEKLRQTVRLARKVAPTSAPVLISGESGTGKELISYLIHRNSRRSAGPYIRVNCAALSNSLVESELFGHEKGAFTGAYAQRKGRFEMANGGTLLLDEITETPLRFQAKLLRVLEQQDFERVGGNANIKVNVRIISTTNKNLLKEVERGRFRSDLYYRLSAVRLVVCPLRQRTEDLPELVWHFVNLYARQAQRHITRLDETMMSIFAKYHWPGNVRQLRNVVLTSLILGAGQTLSLADVSWLFDELQPRAQENKSPAEPPQPQGFALGGMPLVEIEKHAILDTLRRTAGNRTEAAKVLGISDRTLRDKIRRYKQQEALQPAG